MDIPKITLSLDLNQINAILVGLGKLPFEAVVTLIDEIKSQALRQMAAVEPKKEE